MMNDDELERLVVKTCEKCIAELDRRNKYKYYQMNSFTRTEQLLRSYPNLDEDSDYKIKIKAALAKIEEDDYYGVIEERYFNNLTFEKIAEIYDVKTFTISRQRVRLVRLLANYLFPNEVVKEILEG